MYWFFLVYITVMVIGITVLVWAWVQQERVVEKTTWALAIVLSIAVTLAWRVFF